MALFQIDSYKPIFSLTGTLNYFLNKVIITHTSQEIVLHPIWNCYLLAKYLEAMRDYCPCAYCFFSPSRLLSWFIFNSSTTRLETLDKLKNITLWPQSQTIHPQSNFKIPWLYRWCLVLNQFKLWQFSNIQSQKLRRIGQPGNMNKNLGRNFTENGLGNYSWNVLPF